MPSAPTEPCGHADAGLIERLTEEGVLGRPAHEHRVRSTDWVHVQADESISDIVTEQRR